MRQTQTRWTRWFLISFVFCFFSCRFRLGPGAGHSLPQLHGFVYSLELQHLHLDPDDSTCLPPGVPGPIPSQPCVQTVVLAESITRSSGCNFQSSTIPLKLFTPCRAAPFLTLLLTCNVLQVCPEPLDRPAAFFRLVFALLCYLLFLHHSKTCRYCCPPPYHPLHTHTHTLTHTQTSTTATTTPYAGTLFLPPQ